jgi:hypothetical protein
MNQKTDRFRKKLGIMAIAFIKHMPHRKPPSLSAAMEMPANRLFGASFFRLVTLG